VEPFNQKDDVELLGQCRTGLEYIVLQNKKLRKTCPVPAQWRNLISIY